MWWHRPTVPGVSKQETQEFKVILYYMTSYGSFLSYMRACPRQTTKYPLGKYQVLANNKGIIYKLYRIRHSTAMMKLTLSEIWWEAQVGLQSDLDFQRTVSSTALEADYRLETGYKRITKSPTRANTSAVGSEDGRC